MTRARAQESYFCASSARLRPRPAAKDTGLSSLARSCTCELWASSGTAAEAVNVAEKLNAASYHRAGRCLSS